MTGWSDLLSSLFERRFGDPKRGAARGASLSALCQELISSTGEVSGQVLASELLTQFEAASDDEKRAFFMFLAQELNVDPTRVRETLFEYEKDPARHSYEAFLAAAEPRRQELIRRLNQSPNATGRLVQMRADLLRLGRGEPALEALDLDFVHLFRSWFNRGFLVLRPIDWRTPAHILEKIIAYEAVHAIDSWDDLRRRLQPSDRRCFAFFHPAMPDDPLIFVEVALTQGVPNSVQNLLAETRDPLAEHEADTAVFYSISNCQAGLAQISFGNSLIKQVAADLGTQLPSLKTFVTLSPLPLFARWLQQNAYMPPEGEALRAVAAQYLCAAKSKGGMPFDPVARFHLGNGALIHDIHIGADTSDKGIAQSHGVMVNYLYDLTTVAQNHEDFSNAQSVASSSVVRKLAQEGAELLQAEDQAHGQPVI